MSDIYANTLPGGTVQADPNLNTFANPAALTTQADSTTDTNPSNAAFDHLQRVADGIGQSVVVDLGKAIDNALGTPNGQTQAMPKPASIFPPKIATWFERNMAWLYAIAFAAVIFMLANMLRLVRFK